MQAAEMHRCIAARGFRSRQARRRQQIEPRQGALDDPARIGRTTKPPRLVGTFHDLRPRGVLEPPATAPWRTAVPDSWHRQTALPGRDTSRPRSGEQQNPANHDPGYPPDAPPRAATAPTVSFKDMPLLPPDLLTRVIPGRIDTGSLVSLPLPAVKQSASLSVDGSPQPPGSVSPEEAKARRPIHRFRREPEQSPGPQAEPRIHKDGSWNATPLAPSFVGIDVSKDRLDVHVHVRQVRPLPLRAMAGEALEQLVSDVLRYTPTLIMHRGHRRI